MSIPDSRTGVIVARDVILSALNRRTEDIIKQMDELAQDATISPAEFEMRMTELRRQLVRWCAR